MSSYTSGAVAGPLWRQRYRYGNGGLPPLNEAVAMPIELVGPMSNSAMYKGWMLTGECGGGESNCAELCSFYSLLPEMEPDARMDLVYTSMTPVVRTCSSPPCDSRPDKMLSGCSVRKRPTRQWLQKCIHAHISTIFFCGQRVSGGCQTLMR